VSASILPALKGWRRKVFGEDALRLCGGQIALAARNGGVEAISLD
jgi:ribonuclease D